MNTQLTKTIAIAIASSILALLFMSCGENKRQFTIEGNISNADTIMLYLEKRGHSDVALLDSVKLNKEGAFSFKQQALDYSEFYRLKIDNQSVNFSVDSIETITITGNKPTLSTDYGIKGSYNSSKIKEVVTSQLELRRDIARLKDEHTKKSIIDAQLVDSIGAAIETYKHKMSDLILDDYKSTAAYFALFQKIDDMLIFDPTNKKDLNLFRAVATVWDTYYPQSPRTAQLKSYTLKAIANLKAFENKQATLEMLATAGENTEPNDFFTITLPDTSNKEVSTKSLKGKIVILDFTAYRTEYSLAHNVRLNQIYEKYKSRIEIYQVSFDNDKHAWMNAASNLPWICVRDQQSLESPLISKFNVEGLPTTYILNREGEIIKKLSLDGDLSAEVAKVL